MAKRLCLLQNLSGTCCLLVTIIIQWSNDTTDRMVLYSGQCLNAFREEGAFVSHLSIHTEEGVVLYDQAFPGDIGESLLIVMEGLNKVRIMENPIENKN